MAAHESPFVVVVAPAGYGKTRFASSLAGPAQRHARAACAPKVATFARNVLEALSVEFGAAGLVVAEARALNAPSDALGWIDLACRMWSREPEGPATFVLDNVEDALDDGPCTEFLVELLNRRPEARRVVLCSRIALPKLLGRHLPPHETERVGIAQLKLSDDESRSILSAAGTPPEAVEAAVRLAGGWPIAVLLLRDLRAPEHLGEAREELVTYLCVQYLDNVDAGRFELLVAAAALPRATFDELAELTKLDERALAAMIDDSPFLARGDLDVVEAHPLVVEVASSRFRSRRDAVRTTAQRNAVARGDAIRAAEIALSRSLHDEAVALLSTISFELSAERLGRLVNVLGLLERDAILTEPRLWLATFEVRRCSLPLADALSEGRRVLASLPRNAPSDLRFHATRVLVSVMMQAGQIERALAELETLRREIDETYSDRIALMERAIDSLRGRYAAARDYFENTVVDCPELAVKYLDYIEATTAFRSGDYDGGVAMVEEAIRLQRRLHWIGPQLVSLSNLAFEAWLFGDDPRLRSSIAEVAANLLPGHEPFWQFWLAASEGREVPVTGHEPLTIRTIGWLFLACAASGATRVSYARRAAADAAESLDAGLRVVAEIVRAEFDSSSRREAHRRLSEIAAQIDLAPLRDAAERYVAGDDTFGVLDAFVRLRLRGGVVEAPRIALHVLTGSVTQAGAEVDVTPAEFALLAYLGTSSRTPSREEVCDALWPDADGDAAVTSLKVLVHRVRTKFGAGTVVYAKQTYSLGSNVRVDLVQAERLVRFAARQDRLSAQLTSELSQLAGLAAEAPPAFSRYHFRSEIDNRLRSLKSDAESVLHSPAASVTPTS